MPDTKELERTLYEIAVAGAFYGLGSLSEVILNHLEDGGAANASAVLQGQALVKIAGGEPEAAVRMIDEAEDGAGPETQVLKALALKRGGQAARSEEILAGLGGDLPPEVRAMAEAVRAG